MFLIAFCIQIFLFFFKAGCNWESLKELSIFYNSSFSFMKFESKLNLRIEDYFNLTITNIRSIRQSNSIDLRGNTINFIDNLYVYLFDLKISHPYNITASYTNLVVEHKFDFIELKMMFDETFQVGFIDDQYTCHFGMLDAMDSIVMTPMLRYNPIMCLNLGALTKRFIENYLVWFPPNEDNYNWFDFILKICSYNDLHSFQGDYYVNKTHKVLDVSFDNFYHMNHQQNDGSSKFNDVTVEFSYSIFGPTETLNRLKDSVLFDYVIFGKNKFVFSELFKGDKLLLGLLKREMVKFESERQWVDDFY